MSIHLETKKVSVFGRLPSSIGAHVSALVDDKYLVMYGGTNGFNFFDTILRFEIETKKWTMMTKYPGDFEKSTFFADGRIACTACQVKNEFVVFFGGCSAENDYAEFLVISFKHIREDGNFNEITHIV